MNEVGMSDPSIGNPMRVPSRTSPPSSATFAHVSFMSCTRNERWMSPYSLSRRGSGVASKLVVYLSSSRNRPSLRMNSASRSASSTSSSARLLAAGLEGALGALEAEDALVEPGGGLDVRDAERDVGEGGAHRAAGTDTSICAPSWFRTVTWSR